MGKKGPCFHCGVANTPLWRNGPPEKPVLCNACGSRWRTKGSLVNYTPLHSRMDPDEYEEHKFMRMKNISLKKKDEKSNKRKLNYENIMAKDKDREFTPDYNRKYQKIIDEDTSNRSSSGSALSNESCAQFDSPDASELTGPSHSVVRDPLTLSWKRPCLTPPKQSPVEKLTKDLYTIFHNQASHFSGSSEEDLLYESEAPMVSVEIGHGSVLIRHPSYMAKEEESEASSLSVNNKRSRTDESYSNAGSLMSLNDCYSVNKKLPRVEKVGKINGQLTQVDHLKREKHNHEKFQVLCNHKSPLSNIDLTEIVNFDVLRGQLTDVEQQGLLKYLPSVDTITGSNRLESMFTSSHFKENLSSLQQLLANGVLDNSSVGIKTEDCKILKRLVLTNSSKSKWVERYNTLKKKKGDEDRKEERLSKSGSGSCLAGPLISATPSPEAKCTMKSPKRVILKVDYRKKGPVQNNASYLTPTSTPSLTDRSSLMLDPTYREEDDIYCQDLLVNIPSNGSFPQAELLCPTSSFGSHQPSVGSSSIYLSNVTT